MVRRIVVALLVLALGAAVIYGIVAGYEGWRDSVRAEGDRAGYGRCKGEWNTADLKAADVTAKAVAKAREEEQQAAAKAAQGERDARIRAQAEAERQAAAARRAKSAADGLHGDLAALDAAATAAGVPTAAACPGEFAKQRDSAIRARAVLGSCVAEYRLLAEDAERERAGLELRYSTALSWIGAVTQQEAQQP
jgi:Protein of unknown function (DUF2514).